MRNWADEMNALIAFQMYSKQIADEFAATGYATALRERDTRDVSVTNVSATAQFGSSEVTPC